VGLQVHDEDVDDRERLRVLPGDVDLVVANRDGDVVLNGELHADVRAGDRGALDRAVAVHLLEGVAGVGAERVLGVDHETAEVEPVQAHRRVVVRRAGAGRRGRQGGTAAEHGDGKRGDTKAKTLRCEHSRFLPACWEMPPEA